ncbi:porin family protein [Marixanthomonas ophiurae]|uniref:tRNA modification GTPase n=1 Tax=Marixanthomonas ophiurae TaxID=387659 RepID=A0A3E1Q8G9_9FLAO|nr:outer membrane beta-barrel protein [Marixanthomonas ophiurae]RFN58426.1 tRNA modification GTPase [Marixanthomonas ophiurae]
MKKTILILLVSFLSLNTFAQIKFEKGYFINNQGIKTNCLIKNMDWRDSPTEIEYKLSENEKVKKASIATIKEFKVSETQKYERHIVEIDRSSDVLSRINYKKKPTFKEEQLFLKVLVEGNATLYLYKDSNLSRYFYKTETKEIEQLVFKKYIIETYKVAENNRYKQQLWNNLKCDDYSMNSIDKIGYNAGNLTRFFVKYNECINAEYYDYTKNQNKLVFNLSIRPGVRFSTLVIDNAIRNSSFTDFGNNTSFSIGLEGEFKLPFNKNKWALIVEPTYQYLKTEKENQQTIKVDYTSVEVPAGLRHYFFLNDKSKIFINASYVFDFSLNSVIEFEESTDLEVKSSTNFAFGIGYNFNDRYSAEFRIATKRRILNSYLFWGSEYNNVSFILGYTIF